VNAPDLTEHARKVGSSDAAGPANQLDSSIDMQRPDELAVELQNLADEAFSQERTRPAASA